MSKQNKLLKGLMGTALALALMVSVSGRAAAAEALGSSVLELSNVFFSWSSGGVVNITDINLSGSAANTGDTLASLDSAGSADDDVLVLITAGGAADALRSCVGNCGAAPAENSTTALTTFPPTAHFASADQFILGSTITIGPVAAGATAMTRADGALTSGDDGSANANTGTQAVQFDFTVDPTHSTDGLIFNFDFVGTLFAQLSGDALVGSSVGVSYNFTITLVDQFNNIYMNASPTPLNQNASVGDFFKGPFNQVLAAANQSIGSAALNSFGAIDPVYTLTIRHLSNMDIVLVPEPATLALVAGGLIFLAFFGLRGRRPEDALGTI